MTVNSRGRWWKGTEYEDLVAYLAHHTKREYPVRTVIQAVCGCGGRIFRLEGDQDEGAARRTCVACKKKHFIGDSGEFWKDCSPEEFACPCGNEHLEVGVGFSYVGTDAGEDIKWIWVGGRCIKCGVLGCYSDWKIDYSPTEHLLKQV